MTLPVAALGKLADNALPIGVLTALLISPPLAGHFACRYGFFICRDPNGPWSGSLVGLAAQAVNAFFRWQGLAVVGIFWRAAMIAMLIAVIARAWRGGSRFDVAADSRTALGGLSKSIELQLAAVVMFVQLPHPVGLLMYELAPDLFGSSGADLVRYLLAAMAVVTILAPLLLFWQTAIALDRQGYLFGLLAAMRRMVDMPAVVLLVLVLELAMPGVMANLLHVTGLAQRDYDPRSGETATWVVVAALTAYQYVVVVGAWTDRGSDVPEGDRAEPVRGIREPRRLRLRAWRRRTQGG